MELIEFEVSDQSINTYGFTVLTAGIDTSYYEKNNIALYNHLQPWRGTKDEILPIGNWEDVVKKGERMFAKFKVDSGDKFARKIGGKVERGVLKSASIGIRILETSKDPSVMVPGQTRETVTKCELREISVVDIPSNKNAIALYDKDGSMINLSDTGENCPVPLLEVNLSDKNLPTHKSTEKMDHLKIVNGFLGLDPEANLSDAQAKISKLMALQAQNVQLSAEIKQFKDKQKLEQKGMVKSLLDKAVKDARINADQRTNFENMFDKDFDSTKSLLDSMTPPGKVSDALKSSKDLGDNNTEVLKYKGKTFTELSKEQPKMLKNLKDNDLETFKKLYKSDIGQDYNA